MSQTPRNPYPTVDCIIRTRTDSIVLIKRKNPPHGWALPGGFVDYGESLENAARREALEETGLEVHLVEQFHAYSDPGRDPRHHTLSVVFIAEAEGQARAADDAAEVKVFPLDELPELVFDHGRILADFIRYRETGRKGHFTLDQRSGHADP